MSEDQRRDIRPDLEQDNDRISALYHASSRIEPPAHLDEVILAASKRAIKFRPRLMSPFSGRWYIPTSMAAVLIIAVVLVPLLKHEAQTPNGDNELLRDKNTSEKLMRERVPASPPSTLEELESIVAPKPARQTPMPQTTPGAMEMRIYSKELQTSPAESPSQDPGIETDLDKQIVQPDLWLARIRHLKETGHTEKAKAQLRRFIARHPDYPLEPSLHKLLKDASSAIPE